jgi:hypothetical protein
LPRDCRKANSLRRQATISSVQCYNDTKEIPSATRRFHYSPLQHDPDKFKITGKAADAVGRTSRSRPGAPATATCIAAGARPEALSPDFPSIRSGGPRLFSGKQKEQLRAGERFCYDIGMTRRKSMRHSPREHASISDADACPPTP